MRTVTLFRLMSVLAAAVAAYAWFRSAAVPFPLLSGAAIVTGVSVLLSAAAEVVALIAARR